MKIEVKNYIVRGGRRDFNDFVPRMLNYKQQRATFRIFFRPMSVCDVMLTVKVTLKSHVYQVSTNDNSEVIKQTLTV